MAGPAGSAEVLVPVVVTVAYVVNLGSPHEAARPGQLAAMMVTAQNPGANRGPVWR